MKCIICYQSAKEEKNGDLMITHQRYCPDYLRPNHKTLVEKHERKPRESRIRANEIAPD